MTIFQRLALAVVCLISSLAWTQSNNNNFPSQLMPIRNSSSFGTLAAAEAALPSGGQLIMSTNYAVTANHSIPSNIAVFMESGGSFTVSSGQTLTILGPFGWASMTARYFFGTGSIAFSQNAVASVDWFGAVNDGSYVQGACGQTAPTGCYTGTDNNAAILAAIKSLPGGGGQVWFPRTLTTWTSPQAGIYMVGSSADCTAGGSTSAGVNSLFQVPDGVNFWGQSQLGTVIMQNPSTNCIMFVNAQGATLGNWGAGFHQLRIDGNAIYDGSHNDTVFHPSNGNSTNTAGCGIYWNAQVRSTTESPSLLLDDVYVTGMNALGTCNNSAVLIYGNGFTLSKNLRIAYNQWVHGMWFKSSDSAFDKLYMVSNGGFNGFENLVIQAGGDNRFFDGYMGGGDGGTAQVLIEGAQNGKWVGMTDDLACGIDMRFIDDGGQGASYWTITGGQITRPGGACSTNSNGISFEGQASHNAVTGLLMTSNGGGTPTAIVESGTASNNVITGITNATSFIGGCYTLRSGGNSKATGNDGCPDIDPSRIGLVTADFTTANNTSLQAITGLTFSLIANQIQKVPFVCEILYSQATAAVADQFGIQSTGLAPTNIMGKAEVMTSASVIAAANLPTLSTTTATAIITFTPSAITTVWNATISGFVENPSGAATTFQLMAQTSAGADAVTVKRGSFCRLLN